MKATIFILSWCSYADGDDYLYSDVKTFTDEAEARKQFESDCNLAYDECEWGSQWDENEDSRDEDCKYDVEEQRGMDLYIVSSSAYDGYKVQVKLEAKEVDVPTATDRRKYGMTVQELRDIIVDFTGDDKREAMRKAKIFAKHISLRHVSEISSMRFGVRDKGNGIMEEDRNWLEFRWRDLEGDGDVFSIIE